MLVKNYFQKAENSAITNPFILNAFALGILKTLRRE